MHMPGPYVRGAKCKHLWAVAMSLRIKRTGEKERYPRANNRNGDSCPSANLKTSRNMESGIIKVATFSDSPVSVARKSSASI